MLPEPKSTGPFYQALPTGVRLDDIPSYTAPTQRRCPESALAQADAGQFEPEATAFESDDDCMVILSTENKLSMLR